MAPPQKTKKQKLPKADNSNRKNDILPSQADMPLVGGDLTIQALIQHFPDDPQKTLDALEKHDPGFTKRMIKKSQVFHDKGREVRFAFGKRQAYSGLAVRIIAALLLFGALFYVIYLDRSPFWCLGLIIFFAVSQGGPGDWSRIIASVFKTKKKPSKK